MKTYLLSLGWTVELARQRVRDCRRYQREYIASGSLRIYRTLNAGFYCRYRQYVATLSAP